MPDPSLKEILLKSTAYLKSKGVENARFDAECIFSHYLGLGRLDLYLAFEKIISASDADKIRQGIIERGKRKPLQYILGTVPFLDCTIAVNEDVLIPRPETEFMVDMVFGIRGLRVLDLCTGSGCIAIALKKKFPSATVYATDICEKALQTARLNAQMNAVDVHFIKSDLFGFVAEMSSSAQALQFDLIISNPPYISDIEYNSLAPELFYEPKHALLAENNGLYFYEKIIASARDYLAEKGELYLEIGSTQAEAIVQLAKQYHYAECQIYKDLAERDRVARLANSDLNPLKKT